MKKYLALLLVLFPTILFAQDTEIGKLNLTITQVKNASIAEKPAPFKGFSVRDGLVIGVSDTVPTGEEIDAFSAFLLAQPTEVTQEVAAGQFDTKLFFGQIIQELTPERWFVLSKLGIGWTMQQLVEYPNFAGLKIYVDGLEYDETLTADDVTKIKAVLLQQNIDLDAWGE